MDPIYQNAVIDNGRNIGHFSQPAEIEWHHSKLIIIQTTSRSLGEVNIIW